MYFAKIKFAVESLKDDNKNDNIKLYNGTKIFHLIFNGCKQGGWPFFYYIKKIIIIIINANRLMCRYSYFHFVLLLLLLHVFRFKVQMRRENYVSEIQNDVFRYIFRVYFSLNGKIIRND